MPDTTPNPLDPAIAAAIAALVAKASSSYQPLAGLWLTAIAQFIQNDTSATLDVLYKKLAGITPDSLDAIHVGWTLEQVNTEQETLNAMKRAAAQAEYDKRQLAANMVGTILQWCIDAAIKLVLPRL